MGKKEYYKEFYTLFSPSAMPSALQMRNGRPVHARRGRLAGALARLASQQYSRWPYLSLYHFHDRFVGFKSRYGTGGTYSYRGDRLPIITDKVTQQRSVQMVGVWRNL